jgi:hypothetical protein
MTTSLYSPNPVTDINSAGFGSLVLACYRPHRRDLPALARVITARRLASAPPQPA